MPAAAGENGSRSTRPKGSLAATMANALPQAGSHSGAEAGSMSAIIRPVAAALRSPTVIRRLSSRPPMSSHTTALRTETASSFNARVP